MSEYKEVEYIFEKLSEHVSASKSLIEKPYVDKQDNVLIEGQILQTLDDGMEVELCLWTDCECHLSFWDVSIQKKLFDAKAQTDFLSYLAGKGLYLGNLKDRSGRWYYCGLIPMDDVYRIQYFEEDGE